MANRERAAMKENKRASGKAARDGGKPAFPYRGPRTRVSSRVLLCSFRDSHAIRTFDLETGPRVRAQVSNRIYTLMIDTSLRSIFSSSGVNLYPRPSTCLQAMRYLAMKHELFADLRRRRSALLQNKKWHKR